jgi:hypothetical protein
MQRRPFSYDAAGRISHFNHDATGTADDYTEDFSYNASGLVSHWSYDATGTSNDATLDVSYSASGATTNLSSNGARSAGATVKVCK